MDARVRIDVYENSTEAAHHNHTQPVEPRFQVLGKLVRCCVTKVKNPDPLCEQATHKAYKDIRNQAIRPILRALRNE